MVEHTIEHSRSIWRLLNDLYKQGALDVLLTGENKKTLFYSLLLSIWLHDIGYKGERRIATPFLVRKNHPLISGELIWRDYRYSTKDDRERRDLLDSQYFSEFENSDELKKIVQFTSLISAFHKRGSPVDVDMVNLLGEENILDDFKYPSTMKFLNDLTSKHRLEGKIMYLGEFADNDSEADQLKYAAALLRVLDSIDKGVHRVGRVSEEDAQMQTTIEDTLYCVREAINEIDLIKEKYLSAWCFKIPGESLSMLKNYLIKFERWIKRRFIDLLSENNRAIRNVLDFEDQLYLRLYEEISSFSRQKYLLLNDIKRGMNITEITKLDSLLDQIGYLIDCPLHHYSHRTFKAPTIVKQSGSLYIKYEFNENFVRTTNLSFRDFNRLFQESWKIWSDICEEHYLVRHILERNNLNFNGIKFYSGNGEMFAFPFDINGMVEFERKLKFDDKPDLDNFIEKLLGANIIPKSMDSFTDEFYDARDNNGYLLHKRGWSIRKRIKDNKKNNVTGIKIKPVFWRREYEYRFEFENGPKIENNSNLADYLSKFRSASNKFRDIVKVNFSDRMKNIFLEKIITYEQHRRTYEFSLTTGITNNNAAKANEKKCYIDITFDEVKVNDIKRGNGEFYIAEFEVKGGSILERRQLLDRFWRTVKNIFPDIEDKICYKSKLDLCLELRGEEKINEVSS